MSKHPLFSTCTRQKRYKDGSLRFECVLGLWSVDGRDDDFVYREAMRYFWQYHADGEYDSMIAECNRRAGK